MFSESLTGAEGAPDPSGVAKAAAALADVAAALTDVAKALGADPTAGAMTIREVSVRYAAAVVALCGGNKSRAARALGIDRTSLYRLLRPVER